MEIKQRKQNHIRVSLKENVEGELPTGLEEVNFVHRSLPEIDLKDVDHSTILFGKRVNAPLIISAITGGTEEAEKINKTLATVAERIGIGISVGSQRIAIQQSQLERTFRVVRENAPNVPVIANIGCPQLSLGWADEEVRKAVRMIEADAIAIHMNPLQEAVQINGEASYAGVLQKITELSSKIETPIIMKETGCGISYEEALMLLQAGAKGFEISGAGGTSWAAVEYYLAKQSGETDQENLGRIFWNWGIPTASSLIEVKHALSNYYLQNQGLKNKYIHTVIASGGIRNGLEMAKTLALGANAVGIAKPFLKKAIEGEKPLENHIRQILLELKTAMFLTGSSSVEKLYHTQVVITGWTAEWLRVRGFDTTSLARRGR